MVTTIENVHADMLACALRRLSGVRWPRRWGLVADPYTWCTLWLA
jgi:hypothetical protein